MSSLSSPTTTAVGRAPGLDTLRVVAALGVLATHVAFVTGIVSPQRWSSPLRDLLPRLDVGVSIFFVMSGLLIARPFVRAALEGSAGPDVRNYLLRRGTRIYPLYWVVLFVSLAAAAAPLPSLVDIVSYATLLNIYDPATAIGPVTQAWSIATEVAFYLFLPAWIALSRRIMDRRGVQRREDRARFLTLGFVSWFVVSLLWRLFVVAITDTHDIGVPGLVDTRGALLTWLPNHLDTFAVGALFAVGLEVGWLRRMSSGARAGCYLVAAGALWVCSMHLDLPPLYTGFDGPQTLARHALFVVCAAALVAPSAAALTPRPATTGDDTAPGPATGPVRDGALTAIRSLALISYGVYLWHQFVTTEWFERRGYAEFAAPFVLSLAVITVVSGLISVLTYWAVERPTARLAVRAGERGPGRRERA